MPLAIPGGTQQGLPRVPRSDILRRAVHTACPPRLLYRSAERRRAGHNRSARRHSKNPRARAPRRPTLRAVGPSHRSNLSGPSAMLPVRRRRLPPHTAQNGPLPHGPDPRNERTSRLLGQTTGRGIPEHQRRATVPPFGTVSAPRGLFCVYVMRCVWSGRRLRVNGSSAMPMRRGKRGNREAAGPAVVVSIILGSAAARRRWVAQ